MHKSTCCRDQPLLTGSPKATCTVLICGVYRLCFLPALGEFSQLLVRTVIAQDDFAHPPNDRIGRCAELAEASGKSWDVMQSTVPRSHGGRPHIFCDRRLRYTGRKPHRRMGRTSVSGQAIWIKALSLVFSIVELDPGLHRNFAWTRSVGMCLQAAHAHT